MECFTHEEAEAIRIVFRRISRNEDIAGALMWYGAFNAFPGFRNEPGDSRLSDLARKLEGRGPGKTALEQKAMTDDDVSAEDFAPRYQGPA